MENSKSRGKKRKGTGKTPVSGAIHAGGMRSCPPSFTGAPGLDSTLA